MGRIIVDIKSFSTDNCTFKNLKNHILGIGGTITLSDNYCEYKDKKLSPIIKLRPDDTIITCKTSWQKIIELIQ